MLNIIYEDEQVAVINKPAGMPVYPLNSLSPSWERVGERGISGTVFEAAAARWPGAEPAHRLDNETSGALVVAKTAEAFKKLRAAFDEGKILKQYSTLVLGEPPPQGTVEAPIVHDPKNKKKMKVAASGGQAALTHYKLAKKFLAGRYSLLEVVIKTGVRHQIRVHLASIGHPIAGDKLYQNKRQHTRDGTGLSRQFLHASRVGFEHPQTGKWVEFECKLPPELDNVLTKLKR